MKSSQFSKKLSQDLDGPFDGEREISPARKSSETTRNRKKSLVPSRSNGKHKRRASKARQSISHATSMTDTLEFLQTLDLNVNSSTLNESNIEQEEMKDIVAEDMTKLTTEENDQTEIAMKSRYSIGDFTTTMNTKVTFWSRQPEKNVQLENYLENDREFGITGILNLSGMNVTDYDLPIVIQRAFSNGSKKCLGLILRENALTSDGVRMIVDTIITGRIPLKYLSFSSNPDIGDAGVEHIVRLLQKRRSIIFLALPRTGMTDRGVRLLADVLCEVDPEGTSLPSLEKLYISFNKGITDESVDALLQILEQNQRLKVLSIEHCSLSEKAYRQLKHVVTKSKKKKFSFPG